MGLKAFDRTVSFNPGSADTKWIEAELAKFARDELRAVQRDGSGSAQYLKAVNGRRGVPEESVIAPGAIVYSFDWLRQATGLALRYLKTTAPRRSGRYRRSFIVTADGREVAPERIALGSTVLIVNTQPYSRKIQIGFKGFESHRGLFDAAARRVRAEFRGLVKTRVTFVSLSGAYTLKRSAGRRKDRRAGSAINYPALEILSETIVVN